MLAPSHTGGGGGAHEELERWYDAAALLLAAHAEKKQQHKGPLFPADRAEAKARSAQLSTSSDRVGVSFAGAVFQAEYFASKFSRVETTLVQRSLPSGGGGRRRKSVLATSFQCSCS